MLSGVVGEEGGERGGTGGLDRREGDPRGGRVEQAPPGELAEVSDRGVVLVDAREGDAPPRNPLFCPWGKVRFLELEAGQEPGAPQ